MVGVPSSNRCLTCKRRKVKCDEAWPACGPCRKGGKSCPGQPNRQHQFVNETREIREENIRLVNRTRSTYFTQDSTLRKSRVLDTASSLHIASVRSAKRSHGSFHERRLSNVGHCPLLAKQRREDSTYAALRSSMSAPGEILARRLASFVIHNGREGATATVSFQGIWLRELPRRVGSSTALDSAVACLVSSHEALLCGSSHSVWLDFGKYGNALRALQKAVDDPEEQFSTNTVAAVALMWRLNSIFAATSGVDTQRIHAQALVHMAKAKKNDCRDTLDLLLTVDCQNAAVQDCFATAIPQPCIFESEEWDSDFAEQIGQSDIAAICWKLFREFTKWPGLLHDMVMLQQPQANTTTATRTTVLDVARRTLKVAENLEALSHSLDITLKDPKTCITKPSAFLDPVIPIVYDFRDTDVAPLLVQFCFYSIVINRMLVHISSLSSSEPMSPDGNVEFMPRFSPGTQHPSTSLPSSSESLISSTLLAASSPISFPLRQSIIDGLRLRNLQHAHTICMQYEQARTWYPAGSLFLLRGLKIGYEWASTPEKKMWIRDAAADLESDLPLDADCKTLVVKKLSKAMSGESTNAEDLGSIRQACIAPHTVSFESNQLDEGFSWYE